MKKALNVGCGNSIMDGYINLDLEQHKGVDVVHDLNKYPYPFIYYQSTILKNS